MNNIKNRWAHLSLREKQTVAAGIILAIVLVTYLFILSPLSNQISILRAKIQSRSELLAWMTAIDNRIQLVEKTQPSFAQNKKSILSIVQDEINKTELAKNITLVRQVDNQSVQIILKTISFDHFIQWLIEFASKEHLQVLQFTASPTQAAGMVNIEIVLKSVQAG